ncbi:uncharacterized protein LOC135223536 isoform X2 [Macrobrachium nipponense]|uniref:uncharacterized protein LOC135223536 isoform X2 n=1 Tax=Macrobrachium nipponense TaxID=159736 RepID=UPI0030C8C63F
MKQSPIVHDVKTYITWWAVLKEKPSLAKNARQSLEEWNLQDEHFQVNCQCRAHWRREWALSSGSITQGMSLLLGYCKPSTVALQLPDDSDSSAYDALPRFISALNKSSCSVNLLLEGDFLSKVDTQTSDYLLLPCLIATSKFRLRRLSCHLGLEAADLLYSEEKQRESSEEDFPSARQPPANPILPVVRYLEVLKVKIATTEVISLLNDCLPYLELLQDLEIHLMLQSTVSSDDVPQISFTKGRFTLRLDYVSDSRADWAGKITASLSRRYSSVWLCSCYMSYAGGTVFLDQLRDSSTLVKAIHIFSANSSRPNGSQFLKLSIRASSLPDQTALYW